MAEQVLNGTPPLHLRTLYRLDAAGRIVSTLEPQPTAGPSFTLIRNRTECIWAVSSRVAPDLAGELNALAAQEPPLAEWRDSPRFAERYHDLLGADLVSGPALEFPGRVDAPEGVSLVDDARVLQRHFQDWTSEEVSGRTPIAAIMAGRYAVSLCACARRTDEAAEASLETAEPFRGQGLAERVTAAWAIAVRESGRIPLYSTSWTNTASLSVARKLGLTPYAASWSLYRA